MRPIIALASLTSKDRKSPICRTGWACLPSEGASSHLISMGQV
jgi:hypothetical protein